MNPMAKYSFHDGISEVAQHINRTLKKGGYFISVCDVYNPEHKQGYPNILKFDGVTYAEILYKIYSDSELIPLDDGDYEIENFYKNLNNKVFP